MTKVSVFGETPENKKELKKIELLKRLGSSGEMIDCIKTGSSGFAEIMLLESKYTSNKLDLIMAWDDPLNKIIYLGHWNDGVV